MRFLAKKSLFVGPLGWLLRRWGAIPVEDGVGSPVATLVEAFDQADTLMVALAPEGTRAGGSAWRSGFWRIADAADVPVLTGLVDGETKRMGLGPAVKVDGDAEAWMEKARTFYEGKGGLKPQNRGLPEPGSR